MAVNVGDEVRQRGLLIDAGSVVIAAEPVAHDVGVMRDGDVGTIAARPGKYVCTIEAPDGTRFAGIVLTRSDITRKRVLLLRR